MPSSLPQRCPEACSGAGASYGQWRMPWSPEERSDSIEIIDWITRQAWSNEQVGNTPSAHVGLHALMSSCACAEHTQASRAEQACWQGLHTSSLGSFDTYHSHQPVAGKGLTLHMPFGPCLP